MFDLTRFFNLDPSIRAERLSRIEATLREPGHIEHVALAFKAIVAIASPSLTHVTEIMRQLNRFLASYDLDVVTSKNTLHRFITRTTAQPKALKLSQIVLYILHVRYTEKYRLDVVDQIDRQNILADGLFDKVSLFLQDGNARALFPAEHTPAESAPQSAEIEAVVMFFRSRNEYRDSLYRHFFSYAGKRTNETYSNETYFLCYRYSTVYGNILKSFLVIKTPARNRITQFSFTHIVEGGLVRGRGGQPEIKKITRGYILAYATSCYLVGHMNRIYDGGELRSSDADTLEVIAIEYEHLRKQRPFIPALTITSAAVNQPIVSRVALVRIGDFQNFGRTLHHSIVMPMEFAKEDFQNHFDEDFTRLQSEGYVDKKQPMTSDIGQEVIESINNIALWERSVANPERDVVGENAGALESWRSDMRP